MPARTSLAASHWPTVEPSSSTRSATSLRRCRSACFAFSRRDLSNPWVSLESVEVNRLQGKDIVGVSNEALARLMEHEYPGNVRELENIIEQAFVLCHGGVIELHHLPPELHAAPGHSDGEVGSLTSLAVMERLLIAEALRRHQGNRRKAARDLGIDPSTLFRRLKTLRIELPPTDSRSHRR